MKRPLCLPVFAASFWTGANANPNQLNERQATMAFWHFSTCVVNRSPKAAEALLDKRDWTDAEYYALTRLADSGADCLFPGDELRVKKELFRGSIAGAMFLKNRLGQSLPTYAANPAAFAFPNPGSLSNEQEYQRALRLTFADCVFRIKPEDVRRLLASRPFSKDETLQWQQLNPILGDCLPATEGTQVRFARIVMRGLLGEAAYAEDSAAAGKTSLGEGASH